MGGRSTKSLTSVDTSGDKEATTKSNLAFWLLSLLVAKVASTWANHTAGSAGQKGGILILRQRLLLPWVGWLVGQQAGLLEDRQAGP